MKKLFLLVSLLILCFSVSISAIASDETTTNHEHIYEVSVEQHCDTLDKATYTCSICNNSYTEDIASSGHEDNDLDGDCDYCDGIFANDYLYRFAKITETGYYDYSDEPTETVIISGYIGNETTIVTPFDIDGYKVIGIGAGAFFSEPIKEVTISSGVEVISLGAFSSCLQLEKVVIESCEEIYPGAFMSCLALKEVKLPENLKVIDLGAFMSCLSLKEMVLPKSLQVLDAVALEFSGIKDIHVKNYNTVFGDKSFGYNYDFSYTDETTNIDFSYEEISELYTEFCALRAECSSMMKSGATPEEIKQSDAYQMLSSNENLNTAFNIVWLYSYEPRIYYVDNECTIYGYEGSTAETYATENGINFVAYEHTHNYIPEITKKIYMYRKRYNFIHLRML